MLQRHRRFPCLSTKLFGLTINKTLLFEREVASGLLFVWGGDSFTNRDEKKSALNSVKFNSVNVPVKHPCFKWVVIMQIWHIFNVCLNPRLNRRGIDKNAVGIRIHNKVLQFRISIPKTTDHILMAFQVFVLNLQAVPCSKYSEYIRGGGLWQIDGHSKYSLVCNPNIRCVF